MADRSYLAGMIPPPTAGATVNSNLNLFDLPPDGFRSYLNELAAQGVNTDELMRQYRRANSPFSGLFDWAINSERDIANEGRTTAGAGLFSKEAGTTGMDALASTRIEPANFIAGLLSDAAFRADAPAAALKGLIPPSDMQMEALGLAGMAQLGGAASMGRGVFDYDPNVARAIYGGSVDDALSLAKSGDAIFHSGNASIADDIHKYGVEPTNTGAWITEVAAGAVDDVDEFLSQNPSVSWWADAPDWVKSTAARAAGKHVSDLTDEDIRKFGHLSIARGSDWGDEVFRIPEEGLDNGEYSYVTDLLGNRQRLYETPLYEYGDDGVGRYPFGIERNELVTSANIDPEFTLTGDELVDFLNRYNTTSANRDATTGAIASAASSGGFDEYLRRVNPQGYRVDANDRPNLMMGDMYGMLPRDARRVGERDGVSFYQAPEGAAYATAFNPDVGEMDVVGYAMPRGDMTDLAVVNEMQGRGIGSELQYLMRSQDPYAPTGGLTEAGEASLRRTYNRLRDEGIVSANRDATTGAIALPAARNEAERMARQILEMRAAGRAGDVTDAMMAQADPQYMFNNTPLPMDEASRMARAGELGFGGDRYHGSNMDFQNFSGSAFTSDNPTVASTYNRGMQDAVIYPLMTREGVGGTVNVEGGLSNWNQLRPDMIDVPYVARELDMGMPISTRDVERQAKFEGFSGVNFNDINDLGPGFNSQQFKNIGYTPEQAEAMRVQYLTELSSPSNVDVRFYPNLSRSRFARFDPEFSHLANLNAATASPLAGILAMPNEEERNRQLGMLFGGYR